MGGGVWRGQGPESVGPSATRGEVLQMDGAGVQPGGHLRLPPAHPRVRHLGHGLPRAGGAGVHPLEVLGWPQLHLALYWGPGKNRCDELERINKDMQLILYSPEFLGLHSM